MGSGRCAEENEKWERSGKRSKLILKHLAQEMTIAKQLAKLYTKCLTARRILKIWKEANMVIFFQEREQKILQTNLLAIKYVQTVHKNHNKYAGEETIYENQPREQEGFRDKYSTTDHIHAIKPD